MLKTVGWGHKKRGNSKTGSAGSGLRRSGADLQKYLSFGDEATQSQIKDYLEHGHGAIESRVRAYRSSPSIPVDENSWAQWMQATREQYGKDSGRTYGHFVISPDPKDKVSAEECADVAAEWAEGMFPGCEWVVIIHDDNKDKITHAHIVVNAVHPDTGMKIQISASEIDNHWDVLQQICREHGIRDLPEAAEYSRRREKTEQAAKRDHWEREAGSRSWKERIRGAVDLSCSEAEDWDRFIGLLRDRGVEHWRERATRGGGLVFHIADAPPTSMRVRAANLGSAYTEEALRDRLGTDFDGIWAKQAKGPLSTDASKRCRDRTGSHAPGSPLGPSEPTLLEWALQRRARWPMLRGNERVLGAIAILASEGTTHYSDLLRRIGCAMERVSRCEDESRTLAAAAAKAERILSAAIERDQKREELARLTERTEIKAVLAPEERTRLKSLRDDVTRLGSEIERGLSRASVFLRDSGADEGDDADRARALLRLCRTTAEEAQRELDEAAAELDAISEARRAVDYNYCTLYGDTSHGPRAAQYAERRQGRAKDEVLRPLTSAARPRHGASHPQAPSDLTSYVLVESLCPQVARGSSRSLRATTRQLSLLSRLAKDEGEEGPIHTLLSRYPELAARLRGSASTGGLVPSPSQREVGEALSACLASPEALGFRPEVRAELATQEAALTRRRASCPPEVRVDEEADDEEELAAQRALWARVSGEVEVLDAPVGVSIAKDEPFTAPEHGVLRK